MTGPDTPFAKPRYPVVTMALLFANLVGFLVELRQGSELSTFLNSYSFVPAQTLAYLEHFPGTSFSRSVLPFFLTLFFHAGFAHLVINTFFLWLVGDVMEGFLGRVRFLLLWFAGAVVWGAVTLATIPASVAALPCLGSSGGIAIIIGAYLGTYRHLLQTVHSSSRRKMVLVGTPIAVAALCWFPLQFLTGLTPLAPSVDTEYGPQWWGINASFILGVLLVQFLLPAAPTGAEALAQPTLPHETASAAQAGAMSNCTPTETGPHNPNVGQA